MTPRWKTRNKPHKIENLTKCTRIDIVPNLYSDSNSNLERICEIVRSGGKLRRRRLPPLFARSPIFGQILS
ncbi:hypothetical protein TcasGA2_TC006475 [Tribolium castaneum]|uniref:Uncharacterized protein n=1 Tax=Tribolium castaneum TaxID=7070 RepID=D6WX33_TRICA|nr:hypothetical protein TcasGA2_TC006475 [Tribolium castaneum]